MGANTTYYCSVPRPRQYMWVEISALTAQDAIAEATMKYGDCAEAIHCYLYDQLKVTGGLAHD